MTTLNPKSYPSTDRLILRDWQHAARLYVDDTYRLAPRPKWLHYSVFNLNPNINNASTFSQQDRGEVNYLVKRMDLPRYTLNTENLNQYNRKTTSYTKITYEPVNITFHDDNNGTTNALWALYYGYYFADRNNSQPPYTDTNPAAYRPHTYDPKSMWQYRYGLDNGITEPFFNSIQLITMSRRRFSSYLLCNPKIISWEHDTMDQSEGNGVVENKMSVIYDSVIYTTGTITQDRPTGFAKLHYDLARSPLIGGQAPLLYNNLTTPEGASLYRDNRFNPIDTSISKLQSSSIYGNRQPYGYGNISSFPLPVLTPEKNTTSGFQNYDFGNTTNETRPNNIIDNNLSYNSLLYNTDYNSGNRPNGLVSYANTNSNSVAPIDRAYTTGANLRSQAINNEYSATLIGARAVYPPIIYDAYTNSLPRDTQSSIESKIFSDVIIPASLPETLSGVTMDYYNTPDVQSNSILTNELINNNPQLFDIPEDPFD